METVAVIPSHVIQTSHTMMPWSETPFSELERTLSFLPRPIAEMFPPHQDPIRQLVTQVMLFVIPHEVYRSIQQRELNQPDAQQTLSKQSVLFGNVRKDGDARLIGTFSSALGGHVNEKDFTFRGIPKTVEDTLANAARRELSEELYAEKYEGVWMKAMDQGLVPFGVLCSDAGETEKIHVGFVYVLAVSDLVPLRILEPDKLKHSPVLLSNFRSVLNAKQNTIDSWSQTLLSIPSNSYIKAIAQSIIG